MPKDHLDPARIKTAVADLRPRIRALLDRLVEVNSYSHNGEGVARALAEASDALPDALRPVTPPLGDRPEVAWFETPNPAAEPMLLVGHVDTVFGPGEFDQGVTESGRWLHGPGTADMKGGVVVMIAGLWVLAELGRLDRLPVQVFFNGDEEIGSVHSAPALEAAARKCRLGLVFECGGPGGSVVTARRGLRRYRFTIKGQGGHAGFQGKDKQSALVELAHQILRLEAMNKPKQGVTINVGRASGGTAANVVPAEAEAELELRFWDPKMGNSAAERIMASLASPVVADLDTRIVRTHARPAMPKTPGVKSLYKSAAAAAARQRITLADEARLGASDANLLVAAGLPTIDGLGPVGENDHSVQERILSESLYERVELLVRLLWDLKNWRPERRPIRPRLRRS